MIAATPLEGKVACVTGASAGLGRAIAEALVGAGAKVVAVARRRSDWCDGTNAVALSADLSDPGRAKGVARAVSDPFGPPDILVNAAGVNTREAADEVT
ncbi:SDR family NAD(P)-dependent oxidoreductase, partial [Rhodovulum sulfidophilum]|nr:SDR family NAD(P)-dependent oxidoreductase [Rhodovulum sulfidophilum]